MFDFMRAERKDPKSYWSKHTVSFSPARLRSASASLDYFDWRNSQYPGYIDLMPVSGLSGLDVLDFGCGPGHDLVGIATYSSPRALLGIDVSEKAVAIAQKRIALHGFGPQVSVKLYDGVRIPLPDASLDFIHSSGVVHHLSDIPAALSEFARVLRPNGRVKLMVYNQESVWWHLYVPYVLQIRRKRLPRGLSPEEAFRMSTDGRNCPVSQAFTRDSFAEMAKPAGFATDFLGSSISVREIRIWDKYHNLAIEDKRLDQIHRNFLVEVRSKASGESAIGREKLPGVNLHLELERN